MDKEDRLFVREVGVKAAKVLKGKNIKLWLAFKQKCEENAVSPELELGNRLLLFTRSILDGDEEYASEILSKSIKLSRLQKRNILEDIDLLLEVKERFKDTGADETDKLINKLLTKAIEETKSPADWVRGEEERETIIIDDNLLAQLPPDQLEYLAKVALKVKEEKEMAMKLKSEELEKMVKVPVEGEEDAEEEFSSEEGGEGNGDSEESERISESS